MSAVDDPVSRLRQIDLNLLVALHALLEEGSVTRAGERVGITQSAMSHNLKRLRDVLSDPLLVRAGGEMVLTPRAQALAGQVRGVLSAIEQTFREPDGFDPGRSRRTFHLVCPDLFAALVLPRLWRAMQRRAPNISVHASEDYAGLLARLETGALDVAITAALVDSTPSVDFGPPLDPDLLQRRLFEDGFAPLVRAGHPLLRQRRRVTPERFAALEHVLVSPSGRGPGVVDAVLEELGLRRKVRLRVSSFATALAVIAQTDLVVTAPSAARARAKGLSPLRLALPLPRHKIDMVWHRRFDADPGHRWLREQLVGSTRDLAEARP